jgi:hypothetical protein
MTSREQELVAANTELEEKLRVAAAMGRRLMDASAASSAELENMRARASEAEETAARERTSVDALERNLAESHAHAQETVDRLSRVHEQLHAAEVRTRVGCSG